MILSIFPLLIFIILLLRNERHGIIAAIIIDVLIPKAITLGSMSILNIALSILFLFYLIKFFSKRKVRKTIFEFPAKKPLQILIFSLFIVTLANSFFGFQDLITEILKRFLFGLLIWISFNKEEDTSKMFKVLGILFIVIALYGFIGTITNSNPYIEYIDKHYSTDDVDFIHYYDAEVRENTTRTTRSQSFFNHPIRYGGHLALVVPFVVSFLLLETKKRKKFFYFILMSLLIIGIITSNSRSPILQLMISLIVLFLLIKPRDKFTVISSSTVLLFLSLPAFPFFAAYSSTIGSLFEMLSGDTSSSIGGSSIEMRLNQLKAAYSIFIESPIFGRGIGATAVLDTDKSISFRTLAALHGDESFLFQQMITTGLVGIIAYTLFFGVLISSLLKLRNHCFDKKSIYLLNSAVASTAGYIILILATGELDTFYFYFILMCLTIRTVYNINLKN